MLKTRSHSSLSLPTIRIVTSVIYTIATSFLFRSSSYFRIEMKIASRKKQKKKKIIKNIVTLLQICNAHSESGIFLCSTISVSSFDFIIYYLRLFANALHIIKFRCIHTICTTNNYAMPYLSKYALVRCEHRNKLAKK